MSTTLNLAENLFQNMPWSSSPVFPSNSRHSKTRTSNDMLNNEIHGSCAWLPVHFKWQVFHDTDSIPFVKEFSWTYLVQVINNVYDARRSREYARAPLGRELLAPASTTTSHASVGCFQLIIKLVKIFGLWSSRNQANSILSNAK